MAHQIMEKDSFWSFRQPAWHRLGTVADKQPRSIDDALEQMGIAWKVEQERHITMAQLTKLLKEGGKTLTAKQLVARASEFTVPGWINNVRADTGDTLGVVTDAYEPFQHRAAFGFAEGLLGKMLYETGFSLYNGKQVGMLLRLPEFVTVGGDQVATYLYLRTRHDGTASLWILPTAVRVVCANTDHAAISRAEVIHKVRHVGDQSVAIAKAREALSITVDYAKQFKKFGDRLAKQKITERKVADVMAELYPAGSDTDRAVRSADRRRDAVLAIFKGEGPIAATVGNAPGTKWCAYQAITEFDQWLRPVRGDGSDRGRDERRFTRAMDDPDGIQARALELIVAA